MKKITLILGGIRSGKSVFAENKALFYSDRPVYLATSIPFDDEMKYRVEIHKERRKDSFINHEEPYDITGVLENLYNETVLVDCMTINLSNILLNEGEEPDLKKLIETGDRYIDKIKDVIIKNDLNVIFVSNEVGTSPVLINKLGRVFQDLQGRWNRKFAEVSDEVYFVRAGIPQLIKKEPVRKFRIGAPSYLYPTGYVENVSKLIEFVDDIQILLFDSRKDDPLFRNDTIMTLDYLKSYSDISYTVHMQTKPSLFKEFDKRLENSIYAIEKLNQLNIKSYTFHYDLPAGKLFSKLSDEELKCIDEIYINFFNAIKEKFPDINISLENTGTPLSHLDKVVESTGISYCIDIGHLLFRGFNIDEIKSRIDKASVVHFHGINKFKGKEKDHMEVKYDKKIFRYLEKFEGILTIENYHPALFDKSIRIISEYF